MPNIMKRFNQFLLILLLFLSLAACKQDGTKTTSLDFKANPALTDDLNAYNANKNGETGAQLIKNIMTQLGSKNLDKATTISYMEKGYEIATEQNLTARKIGFLYPLIKADKNSAQNENRLADLANIFFDAKKEAAANVLANGFIKAYPSSEHVAKIKDRITTEGDNIDAYILGLGEKIFDNADLNGLNRDASTKYIDACQAHALAYPNSASSPNYLYKAAEVAKSIRSNQKALSLYDWILEEYPNYEKAPTTLFIKGFIIENELKNVDLAKTVYNEFLTKYPQHDLADDVQFLLDNLGKSDEEIAKIIEQKQAGK